VAFYKSNTKLMAHLKNCKRCNRVYRTTQRYSTICDRCKKKWGKQNCTPKYNEITWKPESQSAYRKKQEATWTPNSTRAAT